MDDYKVDYAVSHVVAWTLVLDYFQECRERALQELAGAEDVRGVGKAQGKIELCNELLNLKSVFETVAQAEEEVKPHMLSPRIVSREAYRAKLKGA